MHFDCLACHGWTELCVWRRNSRRPWRKVFQQSFERVQDNIVLSTRAIATQDLVSVPGPHLLSAVCACSVLRRK